VWWEDPRRPTVWCHLQVQKPGNMKNWLVVTGTMECIMTFHEKCGIS
jgi:hypothetical protein